MAVALRLLYLGVTSACVLLLLAGAFGGYAVTIQGESAQVAEGLLGSYVYAITIAALASVLGAGILILGVTREGGPYRISGPLLEQPPSYATIAICIPMMALVLTASLPASFLSGSGPANQYSSPGSWALGVVVPESSSLSNGGRVSWESVDK